MANQQLRRSARSYSNILLIFCAFGIFLSVYALYVEIHAEGDSSFKAWCDINKKMSCSKVFTSRYGKGFGLLEYVVGKDSIINQPNSIFGIIFYLVQIACAMTSSSSISYLALMAAVLANFGSVYLAYILVFILDDICVVCCTMYVVNAVILGCCFMRHNTITQLQRDKKNR